MIKGIIFDLDMCILDTYSLKGSYFQPVLDAFYNSDLPEELKKEISIQLMTTSLEDVISMFDIPAKIAEAMRKTYREIEVPDGIKSYGDEECIRDLSGKKILVTSGYRKFQETKIAKLGIAGLFDEIIIDALDLPNERKGKTKIFKEILETNNWDKNEVIVIGDNPESELGAAKSLGIITIQTLRPTINKWEEADYHIKSLCEIEDIIQNIAAIS